MKNKKFKLTAEERRIEEEVLRGEWKPASAKSKAALLEAASRKVAEIRRGGARPGAGRKPKPVDLLRVPLSCRVKPTTLRKLRARVGKTKKVLSIGSLIDDLAERL
ncbi:MAG: hypothetical protein PW734_06725 [Verrucomicrobium sp.]|nr:hypothetical protein [Verrucomicrobium sp.]